MAFVCAFDSGTYNRSYIPFKVRYTDRRQWHNHNAPAGVIDQNAILGEGEISVPDKTKTRGRQIKVYGIPELPLAANTKEQSFVFSNPEENPCFFVIEIELSDTGEVIYTSNLLPPGYSISKFTLNRELAAGTYPATIHVKTYSFDKEQRKLNNMDLKTTIVVS